MDLARLKSIAVLGYNFNLHILRSLLRRDKEDQAELFLSYFQEDRINGLSEKEHGESLRFEGCVACGLCPASCRVMEISNGRFLGPQHIACAASRSYPDLYNDADSLLLCAVCGQCEPVCPEGVPIASIARAMRSMIWRVAPEVLPEACFIARDNLEAYGNIYGEPVPLEGAAADSDTALVLGPLLRRHAEESGRVIETLYRLGYEPALAEEGSIGGVAESLGLTPDTSWINDLAGFKNVIVADPDVWLALLKSDALERSRIMFITQAVEEKLGELDLSGAVQGPVAVHDTAALGRYSTVSADVRRLLSSTGIETVPLGEELDNAPPIGWEGGLNLVDPQFAGHLVRARFEDALQAGAGTLVTPCFQDVTLAREHAGRHELAVKYLMDMVYEALCKD